MNIAHKIARQIADDAAAGIPYLPGDGVSDATAAIQTMLNGGAVRMANGELYFARTIHGHKLTDNQTE